MLGSDGEADDAVQEAWLKVSRSDTGGVENLGGWLTTVVARVCLDMLRARRTKREEPFDTYVPDPVVQLANAIGPEREAELADSVGLALLVVLETLAPAERVAFVLHDMFAVPFDEIAPIVDRTPDAARQLASRARRRVQGATVPDLTAFDNARWSTPSSQPPAAATSTRSSRCSIPTSCCAPTAAPVAAPRRPSYAAQPKSPVGPSPSHSPCHARPVPCTGRPASSSSWTASHSPSWGSPSPAAGSSRSTCSPTPNASPSSTCPNSRPEALRRHPNTVFLTMLGRANGGASSRFPKMKDGIIRPNHVVGKGIGHPDTNAYQKATADSIYEYLEGLLDERASVRRDDLLSQLLEAEVDG